MKIIEKACVMCTFALILEVQSMFSYKNTFSLRFYKEFEERSEYY